MSTVEKDPAKGLNAAVAATLNGERVASGMTFDELASATGISKRTLLRYLSSKERDLTLPAIVSIASVFNLSLSEVMDAAEKRLERTERTPRGELSHGA